MQPTWMSSASHANWQPFIISLPLSSAVLLNSGKHGVPQFPPRLKVQRLKPNQWARAPNRDQQLHALKLSDIRGWSMLCEDTVPMIALHIPEEDRCVESS